MTMSFYILNDNFDYFLEANPFLLEILMIGRIVTTPSSIIHAFKQQSVDVNCYWTSPSLLIRPLLSHSVTKFISFSLEPFAQKWWHETHLKLCDELIEGIAGQRKLNFCPTKPLVDLFHRPIARIW